MAEEVKVAEGMKEEINVNNTIYELKEMNFESLGLIQAYVQKDMLKKLEFDNMFDHKRFYKVDEEVWEDEDGKCICLLHKEKNYRTYNFEETKKQLLTQLKKNYAVKGVGSSLAVTHEEDPVRLATNDEIDKFVKKEEKSRKAGNSIWYDVVILACLVYFIWENFL